MNGILRIISILKHKDIKGEKKEKKSEMSDTCIYMNSSPVVDGSICMTSTTFNIRVETTEFISQMTPLESVSHESNEIMNVHTKHKKVVLIRNSKIMSIFGVN